MKKTVKVMSIILLAVMFLTVAVTMVNAVDNISGIITDVGKGNYSGTEVTTTGKKIVGIVQVVGIVVAVVVILVIGIKYLVGSAEQKAEYKKTMIPYIVGAVLVFAGSTIVNVIYNVTVSMTNGSN